MKKESKLIAVEFGHGAQFRETVMGPKEILNILKQPYTLIQSALNIDEPLKGKASLPAVVKCISQLALIVNDAIKNNNFPLILGGDHSIAIGTWSGVIKALNAQKQFGLIWIDAHMDAHTFKTSPSKAYHGMPLAALLGFGDKELVNLESFNGKLDPKHVVLIGIRSFEDEEKALLENLGVKIYYANEVHNHGIYAVMNEAIRIVSQASCGYGISLDLDFFDPSFAPGIGSPIEGGFDPKDFIGALKNLDYTKLQAFEIVELNPKFDIDNRTATLAATIVKQIIDQLILNNITEKI